MPLWRRRLNFIAGLAILAGLGFWLYRGITAEGRVKATCDDITAGMTVAQVQSIASSKGLDARGPIGNVSFVVAPETMGELGCRLTWISGVVVSSQYDGPADDL
jgi:hypothetical protein